jgi:hypothetical protein
VNDVLYKYRGIKEFRYFVDIVLNSRLYAAPYFELNDPMEGHYLYSEGELDSYVRDLIKGQKGQIRLCSLSRTSTNELMWSHYAEGHRGVAIGVEISSSEYDVRGVEYGPLPWINQQDIHNSTGKEILSHKLEVWKYEEEVRAFTSKKQYVDVNVKEVLLGQSMSTQDVGFIRKLVERIGSSVEVKNANGT